MLEFVQGKIIGVDDHSALGAAVGQADEGAFPTHPHGERGDLAEGHVLVKADAALGGAGGEIVLDAVALEDGHGAIVALHWQRDGETAAGVFGAIAQRIGKVDGIGGLVELTAGHLEDFGVVKGRNNGFGHTNGRKDSASRVDDLSREAGRCLWAENGIRAGV